MRELLAKLTQDNYEGASVAMRDLLVRYPARGLALWLRVLEFTTPKLQAIALQELPKEREAASVRELTDAELTAVIHNCKLVEGEP